MKTKQLLKILIGAAWIDGELQQQERVFLKKMVVQGDFLDDPDIQSLLLTTNPIPPSDCYRWLKEYLGENPQPQDYRTLIDSIIALAHVDGEIKDEEAELIRSLQQIEPSRETTSSFVDKVFNILGRLTKSNANYYNGSNKLQQVKKIEIVVNEIEVPTVLKILKKNQIRNYSLIKNVSGMDEYGYSGDDLINNSYIMIVCSKLEIVEQLSKAMQPVIERLGGTFLVTDAQWLPH